MPGGKKRIVAEENEAGQSVQLPVRLLPIRISAMPDYIDYFRESAWKNSKIMHRCI
jgi:hypothetical protein